MLRQHHQFFRILFQVSDALIVAASWIGCYILRFDYLSDVLPVTQGFPEFNNYFYLMFAIMVLWFVVFQASGLYTSHRNQKMSREIFQVLRACGLAFLILSAGTYLSLEKEDFFSRGVMVLFGVISTLMLVALRVGLRMGLRFLRRHGRNLRYALVVGQPNLIRAFGSRLKLHPELGVILKGCVPVSDVASNLEFPVLGSLKDVPEIVRTQKIDQIILALPNANASMIEDLLPELLDLNVDIRIIPDVFQYMTLGCQVEEFEGLPLISINQSPVVGWNSVGKRILDFIVALVSIVIFSPLMALIYLSIRIFTPGPGIIVQDRMGLDGRLFGMYKFRTMSVGAENDANGWTVKNDNRVTWLGKILRRTSLDELPQLINVLKGEMSCVGPRPERPSMVDKFRKDIPKYMLRHKVKAGMTGWAQVNGWRGDTSLEKRIEFDLYYISNWSIFFDLKIIVMTLIRGFISRNAY